MENSRVSSETIEKYYNSLLELRKILSYTKRISMDDFCIKNKLSKSVPQVLTKGGVIKCVSKGRYSEWEWTTIEPTKQMALKTVQMLGEYNPPRKGKTVIKNKENRGGYRPNSGRKTKAKEIEKEVDKRTFKVVLLWGLISFNFNV